MTQEQVKEIYLRVIDATIEGVRAEFAEKGVSDAVVDSLTMLKSRWVDRLTHTHDFSEDPAAVDKPVSSATAKGAKKTAGKGVKRKVHSPPVKSSRNGLIPVTDLTNDDNADPATLGKPEPYLNDCKNTKREGEPSTKRQRRESNDDHFEHGGEDLDSTDESDGDESDENAENLILAQHDRVRKGPKWKVILKEGIVSIRGREYLFNKATCDLDF